MKSVKSVQYEIRAIDDIALKNISGAGGGAMLVVSLLSSSARVGTSVAAQQSNTKKSGC